MDSTNEKRCYNVTPTLIGWAYTQNDPWSCVTWQWIVSHLSIVHTIKWILVALRKSWLWINCRDHPECDIQLQFLPSDVVEGFHFDSDTTPGILLGLRSANERWCYFIMSSLISWAHIQKSPNSMTWEWIVSFPNCTHFISLRQSDAYMRRWTRLSLIQIMACRLTGAKPLSEPMMGYC